MGIDVLISSSLPHARQTAEIIAPALKLDVIIETDLDEWLNQGSEALTPEEMINRYLALPANLRAFIEPGDGLEIWVEFGFRASQALHNISQNYAKQNVPILAHDGIIEASFVYCFGASPLAATPFMMLLNPIYTSINTRRYLHQVNIWRLEKYNDTSHLE